MNQLWQAMGLEGRRALIIHHDDLGFLEAQNRAYAHLGYPTGSVQMPGPWAAQLSTITLKAGARPDLGVHLTLTSEMDFPRLRPLTAGPSLRDAQGYCWRTVREAWEQIEIAEAEAELQAQIEAALALGLDITHLDTHMGAVMRPDIAAVYGKLALAYGLPALLPDRLDGANLPPAFREALARVIDQTPLPRVRVVNGYHTPPESRRDWYVETLSALGPGVYHLIHHAAAPSPESESLRDHASRLADFEALQDPEVRRVLSEFTPLTYRDVRDGLRQAGLKAGSI